MIGQESTPKEPTVSMSNLKISKFRVVIDLGFATSQASCLFVLPACVLVDYVGCWIPTDPMLHAQKRMSVAD